MASAPPGDVAPSAPYTGSIRDAIQQVEQVQADLERTLDDINEILRTLEQAEREKTAGEREIEMLRDAVRRLRGERNYPRGGRPQSQAPESAAAEGAAASRSERAEPTAETRVNDEDEESPSEEFEVEERETDETDETDERASD